MILFSITRLEVSVLYVVRWTRRTKKLDVKITYNFLSICYFCLCLSCCCLNHWSFFSWVLPSFLNFFSPPLLTRHNTTFSSFSCRLSMPRCVSTPRLERVKASIAREQQSRTDRRVEALLRPRVTRLDTEVSDDSEEETRLTARRARRNRDQATQTDSSSSSFCCGVFVGVCLVVCLLVSFIVYKTNDRQRSA